MRKANVRITEDRITAIGNFEPARGDQVIDAKGLVLAPGFIDIHNHSEDGLERDPLATTQIAQGITTVLLGADGGSPWPIGPWLEQRRGKPVALNLAVAVGTPTVALFGPADPVEFGSWGSPEKHIMLWSSIGCRPCRVLDWGSDAPKNHPCVREIPVGRVLDAARRAYASV